MRMAKLLFIAFAFALAITFGLKFLKKDPKAKGPKTVGDKPSSIMIKVVVSKVLLKPMQTKLSNANVVEKHFPEDLIPPDAAQSIDDVAKKLTTTAIFKGEIVSLKRLIDPDAKGGKTDGLSKKIPPGKRASSLSVDKVAGTSGFVAQDDIVDVIAVFDDPKKGKRSKVCKILLQNIKILATGARIKQSLKKKDASAIQGNLSKSLVVLEVKPEQATTLKHLAGIKAKFRLIIRNPKDKKRVATKGFSTNELLGIKRSKKSDEAKPGSVRVIRAGSISQESVTASISGGKGLGNIGGAAAGPGIAGNAAGRASNSF